MQEPTAPPTWEPAGGAPQEPAAAPTPEPAPPDGKRTALIAVLATLGGAIGVGALALALVTAGGTPAAEPAADAADGAPARVSEAGWTAPDGRTRITLDHDDGRGLGYGLGGLRAGDGFAGITVTSVNGTKLALETDNGWTRTIDAAGATITRGGETIAASAIKAGDEISFREKRNDDGTYTITAIRVIEPWVAGKVASVSGSTVTVTLRGDSTAKVILTSSTTYAIGDAAATKDSVVAGAQIVARGTKASDGTLTATSIQIAPAMVAGTVKAVAASSFTVTLRDDSTVTVKVTPATTFMVEDVDSPTVADVKAGAFVMASGARNADGSITATVVWSRAAGQPGGPLDRGWGPGGRGWDRWFGGSWRPDASPAPSTSPSGGGTNG